MAARKLKVFQTQVGFYDTIVAVPGQAAALKAWGIHQNLFASGEAKLITDDAAVAAALEHPETPLHRAVGSTQPFQLAPTSLPKAPDAPDPTKTKAAARPKPTALPKPPADRAALDAAELALRKLDDARKDEEAGYRQRQTELDAAKTTSQVVYVERREAATANILKAREAYRKAGGEG